MFWSPMQEGRPSFCTCHSDRLPVKEDQCTHFQCACLIAEGELFLLHCHLCVTFVFTPLQPLRCCAGSAHGQPRELAHSPKVPNLLNPIPCV